MAKLANNKVVGIAIAVGVVLIMLIGGAMGSGLPKLSQDDQIALEIIKGAADDFKDPTSILLVSGSLSNSKDMLWCGLSATNSYGAAMTQYYTLFDDGYVLAEKEPDSLNIDKGELNIKTINLHLKKHFNVA